MKKSAKNKEIRTPKELKFQNSKEEDKEEIMQTSLKASKNKENSLMIKINETAEEPNIKAKPAKYSVRLDVVRKSIFRKLKRFYLTLWKQQNYKTTKLDQDIFENARIFATKFFEVSEGDMNLFIVALIDNKRKYSHKNKLFEELRSKIASMMNCINKNKVNILLKYPEFCKIVLLYLDQPINKIIQEKKSGDILKNYKYQIAKLKSQCEGFLKKSVS